MLPASPQPRVEFDAHDDHGATANSNSDVNKKYDDYDDGDEDDDEGWCAVNFYDMPSNG